MAQRGAGPREGGMPERSYRIVFYSDATACQGLPQRLPVATMTVTGVASRAAAIELGIARFRDRFRGVHWIDRPAGARCTSRAVSTGAAKGCCGGHR